MSNSVLRRSIALSFACLAIGTGCAQTNNKDAVLMTVGNTKVTVGEFENVYHKNNNKEAADTKSLNDYVDLFVNFKLKVK
jgi:peptidyl-prolyl cis-trans isomerase SurA